MRPDQQSDSDRRIMVQLDGETMGTYFSISFLDSTSFQLTPLMTSLLIDFNQAVSTYIDSSQISSFNRSSSITVPRDGYFDNVFLASSVYQATYGWFDPTVGKLVNYWGFGYTPKQMVTQPDSLKIDSLIAFSWP